MTDEQMAELYHSGKSFAEISKLSGKTPGAVCNRIRRVERVKREETKSVFDSMFNQIFCKKWGT